ncbi:holo-ACP synthase [Litchfieldia salsa]|uniref:Holo-[acyl-carrier-protein] synthase n=1 Tax=Litchfieldia salsa TaxID=930152 RepID=A0A1H0WXV9_9BACI|nr:holo-ACP synthase [Litchfieldia salsa]SDP95430.1 holo-[acyl-carrier-protein] synthase [Litchfieldia salsa]
MIVGIGIDIVELHRIKKIVERQKKFINRILTEKEIIQFEQYTGHRKIEFLAGRFAAKEAYSKAVGTGIGKGLSFVDIEVFSDEKGKPCIKNKGLETVHLSISHSKDYAVAQVIIESLSS